MEPIQADRLQGVYTALITPMLPAEKKYRDQAIDQRKLDMLIEDQIAAGVQGILACGTTGQSATLDHDEHIKLVTYIHDRIGGRVQFIAGAGSNCTREAAQLTRAIEEKIGPTTFLHVTGYYNNPPQEGLERHFTDVADTLLHEGSNIILYNVPGRTKSYIEPETVIGLAKHPRIIGLKQAVDFAEDKDYNMDLRKIVGSTESDDFRVLSGEDGLVATLMSLGGSGVISASANVAPKMFVDLMKEAESMELVDLRRIAPEHFMDAYQQVLIDQISMYDLQKDLGPIVKAVFCAKNPIPLAHMFSTEVRLPLVKLPEVEEEVQRVLAQYDSDKLGIDLAKYK